MDVAVQLAVQVVVPLVLERRAARRALEALNVQVLVLDAHEHAATRNKLCFSLERTQMRLFRLSTLRWLGKRGPL